MRDVEGFWRRFVAATGIDGPYTAWGFGSSPEQATELGLLVRDGDGRPLCVVRTTGVEVRAFGEVDPEFAWTEGEGDRSLAYWREAHTRFFAEQGPQLDEATPVVLERFELVWDGRDAD